MHGWTCLNSMNVERKTRWKPIKFKGTCGTEQRTKWDTVHVCDLQHVLHTCRYMYFYHMQNIVQNVWFYFMSKLNTLRLKWLLFSKCTTLKLIVPIIHGPTAEVTAMGFTFFFTSLNWNSRENESRHPHMEWAIGLTLTCPQTAKWKNSFICHVDCWRLCWRSVWVLMSLGILAEILGCWCLFIYFFTCYVSHRLFFSPWQRRCVILSYLIWMDNHASWSFSPVLFK